jgi:hypothetical protein
MKVFRPGLIPTRNILQSFPVIEDNARNLSLPPLQTLGEISAVTKDEMEDIMAVCLEVKAKRRKKALGGEIILGPKT